VAPILVDSSSTGHPYCFTGVRGDEIIPPKTLTYVSKLVECALGRRRRRVANLPAILR